MFHAPLLKACTRPDRFDFIRYCLCHDYQVIKNQENILRMKECEATAKMCMEAICHIFFEKPSFSNIESQKPSFSIKIVHFNEKLSFSKILHLQMIDSCSLWKPFCKYF